MFPLGEEIGWRGFAYPRLAARLGPVKGSLVLGVVWGIWHLGMMFTPGALPDPTLVALFSLELALWSVVIAWLYERGGRGLLVAFAICTPAPTSTTRRAPPADDSPAARPAPRRDRESRPPLAARALKQSQRAAAKPS